MKYILVEWPQSLDFGLEEWFQEEAVFHPDISGAYFIPEDRYLNMSPETQALPL